MFLIYLGLQVRRSLACLPAWALDFSFENAFKLPHFPKVAMSSNLGPRSGACLTVNEDSTRLTSKGFLVDRVDNIFPLPRPAIHQRYQEDGGEMLEQAATASIPIRDAYGNLRDLLTRNDVLTKSSVQRSHSDGIPLPREPHSLVTELHLQRDPVSHAFLWWLKEVAKAVPEKNAFAELYQWWKDYETYQVADTEIGLGTNILRNTEVMFTTECGFIGRGLWTLEQGDFVALLHGMELPVILHKTGKYFKFGGLAWVNGATMGGLEPIVTDLIQRGELAEEDITMI